MRNKLKNMGYAEGKILDTATKMAEQLNRFESIPVTLDMFRKIIESPKYFIHRPFIGLSKLLLKPEELESIKNEFRSCNMWIDELNDDWEELKNYEIY